ncbi:VacJ family lipoprotein [Alcanivorax sp. IO_7]|nr:VacJ family lipoprotein [Alcanivorax sp. IO_7]
MRLWIFALLGASWLAAPIPRRIGTGAGTRCRRTGSGPGPAPGRPGGGRRHGRPGGGGRQRRRLGLGRGVHAVFPGQRRTIRGTGPWEGFNRKIFGFNDFVDRYAIKPAAKGYQWITPQWLDDTVTRFFSNLGDIGDSINYVLQWRWGEAGSNLGRFTVNTTLGIAGLFDVASRMDLNNSDTNLDVTLGRWGVPSGPYLVLPILGPSTVRDTGTLYPRSYLWPPTYIEDDLTRYSVAALYGVDLRADLMELERNIVGDRYTFIRNAYLQRRLVQIKGQDAAAPALPDEDPELESNEGW